MLQWPSTGRAGIEIQLHYMQIYIPLFDVQPALVLWVNVSVVG